MPTHKKLTWNDHIQLLEELATKEVSQVAADMKLKEATVRTRIISARTAISEAKKALRKINKICRMSPRAHKFTLSTKLEEEELCI